jgi:RHS repeat-associated protein
VPIINKILQINIEQRFERIFMQKTIKKFSLFTQLTVLCGLLFLCFDLKAQIYGNTSVTVGDVSTYEFFSDEEGFNPDWQVTYPGGTIVSTYSNFASTYYADIRWDYPGTSTVSIYTNGSFRGSLNVSVGGCFEPPSPSVSFNVSGNTCGNKTISYAQSPPSGTTWYWQAVALGTSTANSASSINITFSQTVYLRARDNTYGCWSNANSAPNINVNVYPPPNQYGVTGGGSYCTGSSNVSILLGGSQQNVSYQLKKDGSDIGAPKSGTGAGLTWTNVASGTGSYTIVGTVNYAGTICTTTMSGSVSVTENSRPSVYSVNNGGAYCAGSAGPPITLSGYQGGVNYQLRRNGSPLGSPTVAPNGVLTWYNNTLAGNYTVVATNAFSCASTMNGSVDVTINPLPTLYTVDGGGSGCANSMYNVVINLESSQTGVNYQLFNEETPIGPPTSGTNGALHWQAAGGGGYYSVKGIIAATGCSTMMYGAAYVTENAQPSSFALSGGGSYCSGSTGPLITLAGSDAGVNFQYQLMREGSNVGPSKPGTGGAISWTDNTGEGIYSVRATYMPTGCYTLIFGSPPVSVTINPLPIQNTLNVVNNVYCSPGEAGATIILSNSQTGVNYQLKQGSENIGGSLTGTNAALSWPNITEGTYTVTASTTIGNCQSSMSSAATVISRQGSGGGAASIHPAEGYGTVNITSGVYGAAGLYLGWQRNDGSGWVTLSPDNYPDYANVTTSAQYRGVFQYPNGCPIGYSAPASVTVYPVPTITYNGPNIINYPTGSTQLVASAGFYSYQWLKDDVVLAGQTSNTLNINRPGAYSVQVKGSSTAPVYEARAQVYTSIGLSNANYHSVIDIKKKGQKVPDIFALTISEFALATSYSDGLGRTIQSVAWAQSPQAKDIVAPAAFDASGKESKMYLPYASTTSNGALKGNAIASSSGYTGSDQYNFYQGTAKVAQSTAPYATTVYEDSPMGRATEKGSPGVEWQPGLGHTQREEFRVNNNASATVALRNVRNFTSSGLAAFPHVNGTLLVSRLRDENGNEVFSFTDKLGHTVLKRVQLDEVINGSTVDYLETYYVYDDLGNLIIQVPPKASALINSGADWNAAFRDQWCFVYTYDMFSRLIETKTPGAAPIYFGYDPLDRLVLTQDGNLRARNQWKFVKYDVKNRPVMTGIYVNTTHTTRAAVQANVLDGLYTNINDPYVEERGSTLHGYTNQSFPTSNVVEVHVVNYYDNYDFDNNGMDDFSYVSQGITGEGTQGRSLGFPTGSKTLFIQYPINSTPTWLYSYRFYDDYGRTIQTRNNNHLSAAVDNLSTTVYDFEGKVLKTINKHNAGGTNQTSILNKYDYTPQGRLSRVYQNNNNSPSDQLVGEYEYNELGQVVDKKLHDMGGSSFLQSVDMRYNIRGWLNSINNAQLSVDNSNDETNDYFGMEFTYSTDAGVGNTPYYNGNISAVKWKGMGSSGGATDQRSYKYLYDKSDKMRSATFQAYTGTAWTSEANTLNETLTYDHNGNILTLLRNQNHRGLSGITVTSTAESIDNLSYTYNTGNSNQLSKVEDSGMAAGKGFVNGSSAAIEYEYNTDGSLTSDKNKGAESITYNALGKPQQVSFNNGSSLAYSYDASGNKLRMSATEGAVTTITDYVNGFVYTNGNLNFFGSPEGRVVKNGSNLEYQYSIVDHQGNTRVVFSSAATAPVVYNATYEDLASDTLVFKQVRGYNPYWATFTAANHTPGGSKVIRLNQNYNIASTKSLKVFAGDKVDLEVWAYYENTSGFGITTPALNALISAVAGGFGGVSGAAGESGSIFSGVNTALTGFGTGGNKGDNSPGAYLNYILFDANYKVMDMGWRVVPASSANVQQKLSFSDINVKEAGYIFVYLSYEDESNNYVQFDDMKITHTKTNVVQYNEYYPFGLQTANSWTRENTTGNQFLFNGATELNSTSSWYDLDFRNYDPILGRMHQVDPMADKYGNHTPYSFAFNNPVNVSDPNGADPYSVDGYWDDYDRYVDNDNTQYIRNQMSGRGMSVQEEIKRNNFGPSQPAIWDPWGVELVSAWEIVNNGNPNQQAWYVEKARDAILQQQKPQQTSVILGADGNVKSWDAGANQIYVDLGNGRMELFRDGLARSKAMTPEAFSNGLLSIVNGMKLPKGYFDPKRLYNGGKIAVSLNDGTKAYTKVDFVPGRSAATANSNQGLPLGKMIIRYQGMAGVLTVDGLRSILGYHEYYAHGIELLCHCLAKEDAEIKRIEKSYFSNRKSN